jgi:hypothetical protein
MKDKKHLTIWVLVCIIGVLTEVPVILLNLRSGKKHKRMVPKK